MTAYVIRRDIPPPPPVKRSRPGTRSGPVTELTKTMEALNVGDSFHVATQKERDGVRDRWHILQPKRFCVRREGKGWRVWRVQ